MARLMSPTVAHIAKTGAFIGGTVLGSLYGGPFGGLLLGSVTEAVVESVNTEYWEGIKERWLNFTETLNPFSDSVGKKGAGYVMFSHAATIFSILTLTCGFGYFGPLLEPYFFSFVSKPFQKVLTETICSQVIAKISGAAIDQNNMPWQQRIMEERDKKIETAVAKSI